MKKRGKILMINLIIVGEMKLYPLTYRTKADFVDLQQFTVHQKHKTKQFYVFYHANTVVYHEHIETKMAKG